MPRRLHRGFLRATPQGAESIAEKPARSQRQWLCPIVGEAFKLRATSNQGQHCAYCAGAAARRWKWTYRHKSDQGARGK